MSLATFGNTRSAAPSVASSPADSEPKWPSSTHLQCDCGVPSEPSPTGDAPRSARHEAFSQTPLGQACVGQRLVRAALGLALLCSPSCGAGATKGGPRPRLSEGQALPRASRVDRLVIRKGDGVLEAWSGKTLLKLYSVSVGRGGDGPKRFEGDLKTPEGVYFVSGRHRSRRFLLFLALSYPNAKDRAAHRAGLKDGSVPAGRGVGGAIGIHGPDQSLPPWLPHRLVNWTQGCVALDDDDIRELYRSVRARARVEILP